MHSHPPRVDAAMVESWSARVLHHRADDGLLAWEIALPPGFRCPPHEHELSFFLVLLAGELENQYGSSTIGFAREAEVFHPAGTVHSSVAGPRGALILTLEASPRWTARLDGRAPLPDGPRRVTGGDGGVTRRLLRELRHPQPCSELMVEGIALELLAATARTPSELRPPRWLPRLLERLHEEIDQPVTLRELASELDLPPARLAVTFRRHTGRTIGAYRRELQVELVRRRLADRRHADEPLAAIALAAGFADQEHCTRVFKAATGWTPGRYRAAALDGELAAAS